MKNYFHSKALYRIFRKARSKQGRINPWMTRQFEKDDLRPVPEDWQIGPPHFVGIASGKSGTTWWHKLLLEHPSVRPNRLSSKELSYFIHFGYHDADPHGIETYRQAFAAPTGCISGEWSPGYLTQPLVIGNLAKAAPDAKLLAIVRNPIDRIVSALNQVLSVRLPFLNLTKERSYVFSTYSLFPEVIYHSLFSEAFKRLLRLFPRSQLLVLQYEKCKLNPAAEISRTYRFLNIEDSFHPPSLQRKINTRPRVLAPLTPAERERLAHYFSEDVHALAALFPEIDLSLWPDFS